MGLANYPYIEHIIAERRRVSNIYDEKLLHFVQRPKPQRGLQYNYAYYPVVFKTEEELLRVMEELKKHNIYARRYFWPSLNTLPYLKEKYVCPVAEDISSRIACLPLYPDLTDDETVKISRIIKECL